MIDKLPYLRILRNHDYNKKPLELSRTFISVAPLRGLISNLAGPLVNKCLNLSEHSPNFGGGIRDIMRLQKQFGRGRWRKLKGFAQVRLPSGQIRKAELHWYEAHGIGKKKMKIKRFLD